MYGKIIPVAVFLILALIVGIMLYFEDLRTWQFDGISIEDILIASDSYWVIGVIIIAVSTSMGLVSVKVRIKSEDLIIADQSNGYHFVFHKNNYKGYFKKEFMPNLLTLIGFVKESGGIDYVPMIFGNSDKISEFEQKLANYWRIKRLNSQEVLKLVTNYRQDAATKKATGEKLQAEPMANISGLLNNPEFWANKQPQSPTQKKNTTALIMLVLGVSLMGPIIAVIATLAQDGFDFQVIGEEILKWMWNDI